MPHIKASPKDNKPIPNGIMTTIFTWGEHPVKFKAMCHLLLATNCKYIAELRKRVRELEKCQPGVESQLASCSTAIQQSQQILNTLRENEAAREQTATQLSANYSESVFKINTLQNGVTGLERKIDGLTSELDSKLRALEQKAPEIAEAITSSNDHKTALSQLLEAVNTPEKLEFLQRFVEEGTSETAGAAHGASEQVQEKKRRKRELVPDTPKPIEVFLKTWKEHEEAYKKRIPRNESKFIWSFIDANKERAIVRHIQRAISESCPSVKKLPKTEDGRQIDIGNLKWPQVVDALDSSIDIERMLNDIQRDRAHRRAAKKAEYRCQRTATRVQ